MTNHVKTVRRALLNGRFYGERTIGGPEGLAARLMPFVSTTGNLVAERTKAEPVRTFWGAWLQPHARTNLSEHKWIYVVWCYATPIVAVREDGYVWEADRADLVNWSNTTSRHLGAVSPWLGKEWSCPCGYDSFLECAVARAKEETPDNPQSWLYVSGDGKHL